MELHAQPLVYACQVHFVVPAGYRLGPHSLETWETRRSRKRALTWRSIQARVRSQSGQQAAGTDVVMSPRHGSTGVGQQSRVTFGQSLTLSALRGMVPWCYKICRNRPATFFKAIYKIFPDAQNNSRASPVGAARLPLFRPTPIQPARTRALSATHWRWPIAPCRPGPTQTEE